jgi:hypothetical protein
MKDQVWSENSLSMTCFHIGFFIAYNVRTWSRNSREIQKEKIASRGGMTETSCTWFDDITFCVLDTTLTGQNPDMPDNAINMHM